MSLQSTVIVRGSMLRGSIFQRNQTPVDRTNTSRETNVFGDFSSSLERRHLNDILETIEECLDDVVAVGVDTTLRYASLKSGGSVRAKASYSEEKSSDLDSCSSGRSSSTFRNED